MADTRTPAQQLREAADAMRRQHGPEHVRHAFWSAVADWVALCAGEAEGHLGPAEGSQGWGCLFCMGILGDDFNTEGDAICHCWDSVLEVARAYLGESP